MRYYVNDNAQSNGDHEVHTATCNWLPAPQNRTYLGDFTNCHDAVRTARRYYRSTVAISAPGPATPVDPKNRRLEGPCDPVRNPRTTRRRCAAACPIRESSDEGAIQQLPWLPPAARAGSRLPQPGRERSQVDPDRRPRTPCHLRPAPPEPHTSCSASAMRATTASFSKIRHLDVRVHQSHQSPHRTPWGTTPSLVGLVVGPF